MRTVPPNPRPAPRRTRRPARWTRHAALAITVVALSTAAACGGGGNGSASPGSGTSTPTAARQLDRAAAAMQQVAGYRFSATVFSKTVGAGSSQVVLTGEFEAPDRVHENIGLAGKAPTEVVFAGNQAFVKDAASGAWRDRVQAQSTTPTDVRAAFATLAKAQAVHRKGSTYTFTVPGAAALALVGTTAIADIPVQAHLDGVEISTLTYQPTIAGQRLEVSITYSDVNGAPPVSVPTAS